MVVRIQWKNCHFVQQNCLHLRKWTRICFLLVFMMCRKKEEIGVFPASRSGRDCHFYVLDVLRNNVEKCVRLVAESVLCPKLLDEDIAEIQVFIFHIFQIFNILLIFVEYH